MARVRKPTLLLSVVIPTRNESPNLAPLHERLTAALDGTEFEICFVDDSDDTTPTILARLEQTDPRVRCRFRRGADRDGGLSTAVIEGLRMARGRYVCVMDADLQHPPETIPTMLTVAADGADLVVASRYLDYGSVAGLDGRARRWISLGARAVAKLLFTEARHSTDPLSGFFLCRRALIDGIEFRPVGFKILLELLVCVPQLTVRDVPLTFAKRAGGASKATFGQGWLFLSHVRSLFFQVSGSGRPWKFGIVGLSGLGLFIALLIYGREVLHVDPKLAFLPAFIPSLLWNTVFNRIWTFSDRRGRLIPRDTAIYLATALLNGAVAFAVYYFIVNAGTSYITAGLVAALTAMAGNGITNSRRVSKPPLVWARISADRDIQAALARLAQSLGADRAYVLPPDGGTGPASIPTALLQRVAALKRATLWSEAASHRAQRRTNIDLHSTLLIPIVNGGIVFGFVVCERQAPTSYPNNALERATRGVEALVPALVSAAGSRSARLEERIDEKVGVT